MSIICQILQARFCTTRFPYDRTRTQDQLITAFGGRSHENGQATTDSNEVSIVQVPGIATGLAVTSARGDIPFVEAARMEGKGGLQVTQLSDDRADSGRLRSYGTKTIAC